MNLTSTLSTDENTTSLPGNTTTAPLSGCITLPDTATVKAMKTFAIVIVLLLALIGNCLVVAVIIKKNRLRTTVNYLILNMAICELMVPIIALPRRISRLYYPQGEIVIDGFLGSVFCKLPSFSENLSAAVSMQSLVLLSVERCHAVVYPFKPPLIGNRARIVLIAMTWLAGSAASSANLYTYKVVTRDSLVFCAYTWQPAFDTVSAFKYELVAFVAIFIGLPLVMTTVCYSIIIFTLHREKASTQLANEERKRRTKENRQITFMSILVLAVFLLAFIPTVTYLCIFTFSWNFRRRCGLEAFEFCSDLLTFTYPAVNPIIYYFFNEKFRRGFKSLLCSHSAPGCCRSFPISSTRGEINIAMNSNDATAASASYVTNMPSMTLSDGTPK